MSVVWVIASKNSKENRVDLEFEIVFQIFRN